jgi:AraC family transcriptional regulator of adaptative response / DNA-3-methyladenine glycosylase II
MMTLSGCQQKRELGMELELTCTPPHDWAAMLSFLALRAIPGVESVSGQRYIRTVRLEAGNGIFAVEPAAPGRLRLTVWGAEPAALPGIISRVRRLFDLDSDPAVIQSHLRRDPVLRPLVDARPGLRVPGAWEGFELALRAVLGQQITVGAATTLVGKVVHACADQLTGPLRPIGAREGLTHVFPTPQAVESLDVAKLGMPRSRAATLTSLATVARTDPTLLQPHGTLEEAVARLRTLSGVGEWTAQYIAMRALREADAFPATDIGLQRAMADANGKRPSATELVSRAQKWRPWRAYAAMHLWTADAHRLVAAQTAASRHLRAAGSANMANVALVG